MIPYEQKRKILDDFAASLPSEPPEDGILLLDKPSGPTSHDIVNVVRRKYGIKKVGHTGTLDPLASGLLILLLGKATKRAKEFEGLDKVYEVEAVFGQERDTYDAEGKVTKETTAEQLQTITKEQLESVLQKFSGPQIQKVPPYSAVKINGKPLYKYAREGKPIPYDQLPEKKITIYGIELLDFKPYQDGQSHKGDDLQNFPKATLKIHCSKGTYIRSLVHDIGNILQTAAFTNKLRRTAVGKYTL